MFFLQTGDNILKFESIMKLVWLNRFRNDDDSKTKDSITFLLTSNEGYLNGLNAGLS